MIKILNQASEEETAIIYAAINKLQNNKTKKKSLDNWKASNLRGRFLPQSWQRSSHVWTLESRNL